MQPRTVLCGSFTGAAAVNSSSTAYGTFSSSGTTNATETNAQVIVPYSGKISRLYVVTGNSQPASGALTITLHVNGVASTIVVTIAADSAAGTFYDLTHSVPVASGDKIGLAFVNAAGSSSAGVLSFAAMLEVAYPAAFTE